MKTDQSYAEATAEMRQIITEAESIGPWLDGHLLTNKTTKYLKKDGSISEYPTTPILQYRVGPKRRKSKRIPQDKVARVTELLDAGQRYKELMQRYGELASALALNFKKKA